MWLLLKFSVFSLFTLLLVWLAAVPLKIMSFGQAHIDTVRTVDDAPVAIVFGAGLRSDGQPSDALADRLQVAAELYEQGTVEHILVSGDNRFENYNEPQVMMDTLVEQYHIPQDVVAADFAGRRTYDTCLRAHELWVVNRAILVTQAFHLPRAIWTCDKLGIESTGISASLQSYVRGELYSVREWLAMYKAWIDIFIWTPHYIAGPVEANFTEYDR